MSDKINAELKEIFAAMSPGLDDDEKRSKHKMTVIFVGNEGGPSGVKGKTLFITIGKEVITMQPGENGRIHLEGDNENGLPQTAQLSISMLQPEVPVLDDDIGDGITDELDESETGPEVGHTVSGGEDAPNPPTLEQSHAGADNIDSEINPPNEPPAPPVEGAPVNLNKFDESD